MANYDLYFNQLMAVEKYQLTNNVSDLGGLTYAGITKKNFPTWEGWGMHLTTPPTPEVVAAVKRFYKTTFWDVIKGDQINLDEIAGLIFDFGVNAGMGTAIMMVQRLLCLKDDGIFGRDTLEAINHILPQEFRFKFFHQKIKHYRDCCFADLKRGIKYDDPRSQQRNLLGWIDRSLTKVGT